MYTKAEHPEQYQGQGTRTWNRRGGGSKESAIKSAMDRKENSIRQFADAKSMQIAVSSAFNGAAQIVTALLSIGAIKPEEYWDTQEEWYFEYLKRYNTAQADVSKDANSEVTNKKGRKADLIAENKDLAAQDFASDAESKDIL